MPEKSDNKHLKISLCGLKKDTSKRLHKNRLPKPTFYHNKSNVSDKFVPSDQLDIKVTDSPKNISLNEDATLTIDNAEVLMF